MLLIETDTIGSGFETDHPVARTRTGHRAALKADIGRRARGRHRRAHHRRARCCATRMRQIQEESFGEQDDNDEIDDLRKKIEDSKMSEQRSARLPEAAVADEPDGVVVARVQHRADLRREPARSPVERVSPTTGSTVSDRARDPRGRALRPRQGQAPDPSSSSRSASWRPTSTAPILLLSARPASARPRSASPIASSLGRKYVRILVGGRARRGPRSAATGGPTSARCPAGSCPASRRPGSMNPVFVLDEIDKLAADMRGDPAAAMLEVLDPEQNKDFVDHYVDVPVDLSEGDVHLHREPDRHDQPAAARPYGDGRAVGLHQRREAGDRQEPPCCPSSSASTASPKDQLDIEDAVLTEIIPSYTREAGVRNLEREIAAVCRGAAVRSPRARPASTSSVRQLRELLGPPRHVSDTAGRQPEVGVITGLAWTPVGGDIMFIECLIYPGKGDVKLTGQMGDVMKESAQAAFSWTRANASRLGIDPEKIANSDLHIHLPQGAIKKDGPSAGVALTLAVVSVFHQPPDPQRRRGHRRDRPARHTRCRSAASRRRCSQPIVPASRSCSCPSATQGHPRYPRGGPEPARHPHDDQDRRCAVGHARDAPPTLDP